MKITAVDSFRIELPLSPEQRQRGFCNASGITKISTDEGIMGYGFQEVDVAIVQALLLGRDPFQIERHVGAGLDRWAGAEHALWDIVGKTAGLPLHKVMGAYRDKIPLYPTCVWPGAANQTDVTPRQQAEDLAGYAARGYKAVKIRAWRPDPMDDVEVVRLIRERVGGREKLEVMVDRTAQYSGTTWDYPTALRVANALAAHEATWLEEPFTRGDIQLHARLRAETALDITGGEHQPPDVYRGYLQGEAFDILQPHCALPLSTLKKIAGMAELFGVVCVFHGSHGLDLVGSLQVAATIRTCWTQEVVFTTPPELPEDAWSPLNVLVKNGTLFTVKNGCVQIPDAPGLGIDLDEEALAFYRVNG